MADYSGTLATVALADGDTIGSTGNLLISSALTCAAGATILVYADKWLADAAIGASISLVGTQANPIIYKGQSANAHAQGGGPKGIIEQFNNLTLNLQYVKLETCNYTLNFGNKTGGVFTFNHIWCDKCSRLIHGTPNTGTTFLFQNFLVTGLTDYFLNVGWGNNTPSWTRLAYLKPNALNYDNTVTESFTECLWLQTNPWYHNLGTGGTYTFTDCYVAGPPAQLFYTTQATNVLNVVRCVLYGGASNAIQSNQATVTFNTSYSDIINIRDYALVNTAGTFNSNYDYVAGCRFRADWVVETANPGTQLSGTITRTNAMSAPNKPLTVDNIVEGTPTAEAITITFDSAAGTTGYRLHGVGFIKYGTTSGVYTSATPYPENELEIAKSWTGWDTTYTFKATGHSVTLSNLKAATTYYYKACFIDPLGRIAESAEGSFATVSSGIAITNQQCDDYSATYDQLITLSCTCTADNVTATCNDKSVDLINTAGTSWSVSVYAGSSFGTCSDKPIYFTARTDAGGLGTATTVSNLTVGSISYKTATLLSEVATSMSGAGYTATLTLLNEKQPSTAIISYIKISVPTYSVATLDGIRTVIAADSGSWAGSVTATEYAAPVDASNSVIIYKMSHT